MRIKPNVDKSETDGAMCVTQVDDVSLRFSGGLAVNKKFLFDKVFGPEAQPHNIFSSMIELISFALTGHPVSVLCFGQHTSGKTHTIFGDNPRDVGVAQLSLAFISNSIKGLVSKGWNYNISLSAMEINNENITV